MNRLIEVIGGAGTGTGGAVSSVKNLDGTVTVSPETGDVILSGAGKKAESHIVLILSATGGGF